MKQTAAPIPAAAQPQPSRERLLAALNWLLSQPVPVPAQSKEEAS